MYRIIAKNTNIVFCEDLKTKEEAEKKLITIHGMIAISGIRTEYMADDFEIEYYEKN
tara:strand:- start:1174 stop:1344 length:171 start_codon:yes stop_codon:yes gene_type:complete